MIRQIIKFLNHTPLGKTALFQRLVYVVVYRS